ncbi:MAG: phosphoribosylformimino-5-aminoimidazole carboxamide ribotide isomerase [Lachnospiraceae bacterium]|jgi:phosphoribosylformimino-5-aminoimidazole carboxamide ribotide isomerase|nr:phosphoribosylformimino-5-aminoimidazole carboxamide ribotide isomerase [Lachnospiraceae bacterium]
MEFRPCIDIHDGKVKQIVGSSLGEDAHSTQVNFESTLDASYYAQMYQEKGLYGGHVILLNAPQSPFFAQSKAQAIQALKAFPNGLQLGGSVTPSNAWEYLSAGASHVICTSYVFVDGTIRYDRLSQLSETVGKDHLVLDLSCRKIKGDYHIVTNRWQKATEEVITPKLLDKLSSYADEFLIHGVDVEGKGVGIEEELIRLLSVWDGIPITYAGGVRCLEDILFIKQLGRDRIHVTIGSALDVFGGSLSTEDVITYTQKRLPS